MDINKREGGSSLFRQMFRDENLLVDLLASAPAGIVIVDEEGKIVFFNDEAQRMFGYSRDEVVGSAVEILLPIRFRTLHPVLRKQFLAAPSRRAMGMERNLMARRKDGGEFPIEVGLGFKRSGEKLFVSAVVVDISRRRAAESEREMLIGELKTALEKVRKLSGMLPICANCKKIRDDNGYWNQIETYIRDHSDAEFSHGLCPGCAQKLYPDIYPLEDGEDEA